ncbi:MAG: UbiX family flavin prenyltransferase [Bacteroidia bacterium]|nr:UbiX family flavin prenyltransferase [Bacteroidia bacterium]
MEKHKIVVAITGASGSIYAKRLLEKLKSIEDQIEEVAVVVSKNAPTVWQEELEDNIYDSVPFQVYGNQDFRAPFASGSAKFNTMIICPCSMGTLARIAGGISNDLISRAADVVLKERRKLILVTRDTPINLIHIRNMQTVTEAGAIVAPASPSFYSKPSSIDELADTVVNRLIDLAGLQMKSYRWSEQ